MTKYGPKTHGGHTVYGEMSESGSLSISVASVGTDDYVASLSVRVDKVAGFLYPMTGWLSEFSTEVVVWAREVAHAWLKAKDAPIAADAVRERLLKGK